MAGCGAGGGTDSSSTDSVAPSQEGDAIAISRTITDLATKADPDLCTDALTQNWVDESYPPSGPGALAECRHSQEPGFKVEAESVHYGEIDVDGNTAKATFRMIGSGVGGAQRTVTLLQDGEGVWRVDELVDVKIINDDAFLEAVRVNARYGPGGLSGRQARCLSDEIAKVPHAVLERRAVSDDRGVSIPIISECVGGGSATGAVVELTRRYLADDPKFAKYADCASDRVAEVLNPTQARAYLGQEDRNFVQTLVGRALDACGAGPAIPPEDATTT
jgi:hypothetical protein